MSEAFVNLDNARVEHQRKVMEQIRQDGTCPFCPEQLPNYHSKPILKQGKYWIVTESSYPYEGAKHHFLFMTVKHTETLADIPPAAGSEMIKLLQWLEKEYALESGAFAMRFGDVRYNGASVRHLHLHVIVGDVHNPTHEKIKFKMSVPAHESEQNN